MGWYGLRNGTREQLINNEVLYEGRNGTQESRVLSWKEKKENGREIIWALRGLYDNGVLQCKYIACDLIENRGGEWMHKPMDESVGPYYYSCPVEWLKEAKIFNTEWRLKVYAKNGIKPAEAATGNLF